MLERLRKSDPVRAEKLHPNDKKRIIRALEAAQNGVPVTEHDELTRQRPPRYEAKTVVLSFAERSELYARIDRRVDLMIERGLENEVRSLYKMGLTRAHTAMQAIGYKEFSEYISGELSLSEAIRIIKQGSRNYAKRQISWCKRYENALRIAFEKEPELESALHASTNFFLN